MEQDDRAEGLDDPRAPRQFSPEADARACPVRTGKAQPWGFWATLGLAAVAYIGGSQLAGVAIAPLVPRLLDAAPPADLLSALESVANNGFILTLTTLISAPVVTVLVVMFARMRRGLSVESYLGLRAPAGGALLGWLAALVVYVFAQDALTASLGQAVVTDFQIEAFRSAGSLPFLILAIVVFAPVAEETLVRGFMLPGLKKAAGTVGAIALSSLLWASLHFQYNWYGVLTIFAAGLLLGYARIRTGSVYTPMAMHALMNAMASVQTILHLQQA